MNLLFVITFRHNIPEYDSGDEYVAFIDDALRPEHGVDFSPMVILDGRWLNKTNAVIDRSTEFQSSNEEANNVATWAVYRLLGDYKKNRCPNKSQPWKCPEVVMDLTYNGSLGTLVNEGVMGHWRGTNAINKCLTFQKGDRSLTVWYKNPIWRFPIRGRKEVGNYLEVPLDWHLPWILLTKKGK